MIQAIRAGWLIFLLRKSGAGVEVTNSIRKSDAGVEVTNSIR